MTTAFWLMLLAVQTAGPRFVVHEWGTFTSVSASDGSLVAFHPGGADDALPSFVYDAGKWGDAMVRMETPVVYFYTPRELTVTLSVDFPQGQLTEWYPEVEQVRESIVWRGIHLMPGAEIDLPTRSAPSRYYAARQTDSVPIEITTHDGVQREKMLFYRGIGNFTPPLAARPDGDRVTLTNVASMAIPQVLLFENVDGKIAFHVHGKLDAGASTTIARSSLERADDGLRRTLLATLVAQGLYAKEASAMLATWDDSWFEPGLRAIYMVPGGFTDQVIPMSVEPAADEITRVLVGRAEIITHEKEAAVVEEARNLKSNMYLDTITAMAKHGRFAMAALKHVVTTTKDATLSARFPWW